MRAKRRLLGVIAALALAAGAAGGTTLAQFSATTSDSGNSFSAAPLFYRGTVLADAPVSYWRLGEASGTTAADERGTNPGTYAGGYSLGQAGALASDTNTAADFNGTSGRVSVPHSSSLNLTTRVSIEAWVKPDTVTGTRWILNKLPGNSYYLYILDNKLVFGIRTPAGGFPFIEAIGLVTTGAWQHVVGTFDGSTATLYHNGVKAVEVGGCVCTIATSNSDLVIGAVNATNFFDGGLDEVALYDDALTSTQVQTHYSRR